MLLPWCRGGRFESTNILALPTPSTVNHVNHTVVAITSHIPHTCNPHTHKHVHRSAFQNAAWFGVMMLMLMLDWMANMSYSRVSRGIAKRRPEGNIRELNLNHIIIFWEQTRLLCVCTYDVHAPHNHIQFVAIVEWNENLLKSMLGMFVVSGFEVMLRWCCGYIVWGSCVVSAWLNAIAVKTR